jgi:hypothetical protein
MSNEQEGEELASVPRWGDNSESDESGGYDDESSAESSTEVEDPSTSSSIEDESPDHVSNGATGAPQDSSTVSPSSESSDSIESGSLTDSATSQRQSTEEGQDHSDDTGDGGEDKRGVASVGTSTEGTPSSNPGPPEETDVSGASSTVGKSQAETDSLSWASEDVGEPDLEQSTDIGTSDVESGRGQETKSEDDHPTTDRRESGSPSEPLDTDVSDLDWDREVERVYEPADTQLETLRRIDEFLPCFATD